MVGNFLKTNVTDLGFWLSILVGPWTESITSTDPCAGSVVVVVLVPNVVIIKLFVK